jgi:hypothetical protein
MRSGHGASGSAELPLGICENPNVATVTGERRLGIVLAIGLLAVQVLVAIAALRTDVEGAWAVWIRTVLLAALVVEAVVLWRLLRARRESLAYAVSFGGMFVVTALAVPLIFSW